MILRPATADDRDAVIALAMRFYAASPYGRLLAVDLDHLHQMFDSAVEDGIVIVAEPEHSDEGGELLGFLALDALEHRVSGERFAAEVGWWVEPAYQAGTIGRQLLERAEAWAKAHDCAFLLLSAMPGADGPAVGAFYERRGYQPIETLFMKRVA